MHEYVWPGHMLWQHYVRAEKQLQRKIWPKNYGFLVDVSWKKVNIKFNPTGIITWDTLVLTGVQLAVQRPAHQAGFIWIHEADQFLNVRPQHAASAALLVAHDWLEGEWPTRHQPDREHVRLIQPEAASSSTSTQSLQVAHWSSAIDRPLQEAWMFAGLGCLNLLHRIFHRRFYNVLNLPYLIVFRHSEISFEFLAAFLQSVNCELLSRLVFHVNICTRTWLLVCWTAAHG